MDQSYPHLCLYILRWLEAKVIKAILQKLLIDRKSREHVTMEYIICGKITEL